MSFETYSEKLMRARDNPKYIDIRIKLLIKRIICKIRFVQMGSQPDFCGNDPTRFVNGKWVLQEEFRTAHRYINPATLLKLHSSIPNRTWGLTSNLGAKCNEGFVKGLNVSSGISVPAGPHNELFYDIGRYIAFKMGSGREGALYLAQKWKDIIDVEWEKTKT